MPMRAELSIPAMRDGCGRRMANSYGARARHASRRARLFDLSPEPRMGTSADFHIACLWSAFGLTLTGLLFALGLGARDRTNSGHCGLAAALRAMSAVD